MLRHKRSAKMSPHKNARPTSQETAQQKTTRLVLDVCSFSIKAYGPYRSSNYCFKERHPRSVC